MISRKMLSTMFDGLMVVLMLLATVLCLSCGQKAEVLNQQGLDLLREGQVEEAVRKFQAALEGTPGEFALLYNLSVAYHHAGDTEQASEVMQQAFANPSPNAPNRLPLALLQLEAGEFESSRNILNELIQLNSNDSKLFLYRGIVRLKQGDVDGALSDFEKALDADEYNYKALIAKASCLRGRDPDAALRALTEAVKISEDLGTSEEIGTVHWNLGLLLLETGLSDRAVEHLEKALEFVPNDKDVIITLANVYQDMGKFDRAQQVYARMSPEDFDTFEGHMFLARLQYNQRQYGRARIEVDKARRFAPDNVDAMNLKAMIFAKRHQMIPAIKQFEESLQSSPNQPLVRQILDALKRPR